MLSEGEDWRSVVKTVRAVSVEKVNVHLSCGVSLPVDMTGRTRHAVLFPDGLKVVVTADSNGGVTATEGTWRF